MSRVARERRAARLTLRYTPTAEERERIFQARLERAGGRLSSAIPFLVLVPALGVLAFLVGQAVAGGPGRAVALGMAGVVLLITLPMLVFIVPPLRRRAFARKPVEETLVVTGEGVAWRPAEGASVELGWGEVVEVEERRGVVLFVPARGVAVAVPRRAVDHEARGLDRLREIARARVGERARI